jgi:hypothetical protein
MINYYTKHILKLIEVLEDIPPLSISMSIGKTMLSLNTDISLNNYNK